MMIERGLVEASFVPLSRFSLRSHVLSQTPPQAASTQFSRLQHLESILNESEPTTSLRSNLDLQGRLSAGNVLIQDLSLSLRPLPPEVSKLDPPSSVIVSASICSKFALTGRYPLVEGGEEFGLLLVVVSAVTGKVTQVKCWKYGKK